MAPYSPVDPSKPEDPALARVRALGIDINKAVVPQLFKMSAENYKKWIDIPLRTNPNSIILFDNPILGGRRRRLSPSRVPRDAGTRQEKNWFRTDEGMKPTYPPLAATS
jgi:hypothetical protein